MKSIAVIIHARKTSTRCPNKHLRDLNGTTLIDMAINKGFDVEAVRSYQVGAPMRELYMKVEDIKGAMQRKSDLDHHMFEAKYVLVFEANAYLIAEFFNEKGFDVEFNVELINGKNSLDIKITW